MNYQWIIGGIFSIVIVCWLGLLLFNKKRGQSPATTDAYLQQQLDRLAQQHIPGTARVSSLAALAEPSLQTAAGIAIQYAITESSTSEHKALDLWVLAQTADSLHGLPVKYRTGLTHMAIVVDTRTPAQQWPLSTTQWSRQDNHITFHLPDQSQRTFTLHSSIDAW